MTADLEKSRPGTRPSLLERRLGECARFGVKPGLDAIRKACAAMGDPQDSLNVVHVAGTNGKGAVCALVDSALRAAGFRTGLYTSPHLVSVEERFRIDGRPVPMETLDESCRDVPEGLTYFEFLTATAFSLYAKEKPDFLVLETGLGGRLDATNIIRRPAACAITRIGLDHCGLLGNTIAEIAAEKGGIIKPGVPVVAGKMPDEARLALERIAAERKAPFAYAPETVGENAIPEGFALGGRFNRENAATALAVLETLGIGKDAAAKGFASVEWPGRYQKIGFGNAVFLVDGAHNPPAMRALADSLKAETSPDAERFRTAICGFCADKDVAAALKILGEFARDGIAVPVRNPRSLPPETLARMMRETGFRSATACGSLREAFDRAGGGAVVCGSLFLAGEALEICGVDGFAGRRFTPAETLAAREDRETPFPRAGSWETPPPTR